MKRSNLILAGCCVVLLGGVCLLLAVFLPPQREPGYPIQRQIQYSFTIQNRSDRLLEKAEFWAAAPVKQTATQRCERLETSHPCEILTDGSGNQTLHFRFHNLPPFATKIITVNAYLALSEEPNHLSDVGFDDFLRSEPFCEASAPEIVRLAETLRFKKPVDTARQILEWIYSNVKYEGYVRDDRGAMYALKHKQGDCTEFMYLFSALCRAGGIPARCIGGYILAENSVLKPNDYHNWAEFYDGGLWRLADPQRRVFMKNRGLYVAMRVIGGVEGGSAERFHRFRAAGKGLNARMNS